MKKLMQSIAAILFIVGGLAAVIPAQAANSSTNNNIGFSVSAQTPDNQIDKQATFFDLKMKSGQTQTLRTRIYNTTNRDIRVKMGIHTAYTNSAGAIEYVTPAKKYDTSLRYRVDQLTKIQGPTTVTVPANGSKVVSATTTMPTSDFNGALLGGWYFKRVDQKVTGEVKGATNVSSVYSYVIGIKYSLGTAPSPVLKLSDVSAGMVNYHRSIVATLRNTTAVMIPRVTMKTVVTAKDSDKTVVKATKKGVMLAPNTTFNYPMLLNKQKLQAGTYHLHMVATNSDHKWTFDRDFKISAATAKTYNDDTVDDNGISIWWLIGLGALGMLIIVLLVLWLVLWLKKRRQTQK
ncbi:DUF916 and DUF3324 domain-containing protein [Lactiplantibacillus pentosus]|uniref:DUF916 and DUF3324 domain-containing protein n=1 Tax=Lactiplantibacillus pentosus TaxID=1589 RepID=UPI003D7A48A7